MVNPDRAVNPEEEGTMDTMGKRLDVALENAKRIVAEHDREEMERIGARAVLNDTAASKAWKRAAREVLGLPERCECDSDYTHKLAWIVNRCAARA